MAAWGGVAGLPRAASWPSLDIGPPAAPSPVLNLLVPSIDASASVHTWHSESQLKALTLA